MSYILGIDTGGTNTDCALLDRTTKELICFSKSPTTRPDLETGIKNALQALPLEDYSKISRVCLSTTLATNAIVEKKGCRIGLLLTGHMPDKPLPTEHFALLSGLLDIKGREKVALSESEVLAAVRQMKDSVDAFAVSGYASIRNPLQEQKICKIIQGETDHPVFCAHQLSGSLGFWERTVTTVLNASLIKIIRDFIFATKSVLAEAQISAPIMIIRSDGTLMTESVALSRPVETILSGPAASILGAWHLTGISDACILDMGGTTCDIAHISNGKVNLNKEGARVGGWLTHCQAAEVSTHGIGGDSRIRLNAKKQIRVGPKKAIPLCFAASQHLFLLREIQKYAKSGYVLSNFQPFDCFQLALPWTMVCEDASLSGPERRLLTLLRDGPHCILYLSACLGQDAEFLPLERLLAEGWISHITLTPTDVLHASGQFYRYPAEISRYAVRALSLQRGESYEETLSAIHKAIIQRITLACVQSSADFEKQKFTFAHDPVAMYLLEKAFSCDDSEFLGAVFHFEKPLVAVGGPAEAWIPPVAEKLHADLIVPEYASVANAIGAAIAEFSESAEALIRPLLHDKLYALFLPDQRLEFGSYEEAVHAAKELLKEIVSEKMHQYGEKEFEIEMDVKDRYTEIFTSGKKIYIETKLTASSHLDSIIGGLK